MTSYSEKPENIDDEYAHAHDDKNVEAQDAVFGAVEEGGPDYRAVTWLGASVLMMKSEMGIGILSIPQAFGTLGLIPGVIVLLVISAITTWSSYVVGVFKLKHPEAYGFADTAAIIFGPVGQEIASIAFCLLWIFVAASGLLGVSIGLNAISHHGTCTAVFVAVSAIIGFLVSSVRTLSKMSWLAWVGMISIVAAVFSLTVAVGVQDRPAEAPQEGPYVSTWKLFGTPTFAEAMAAIASIIFAFCGVPAYFSVISEMADPREYPKALALCRGIATSVYLTIGIVVYYYCGDYVASPALGSAGVLMKKVCYGLAIPGLIMSMTLYLHITAKYIFIRLLRGSKHLTANSVVHWATWLGCTSITTIIAYCIASGIPAFGGLVSLVGALFGTLLCFQPEGIMWLYDNWHAYNRGSARWTAMVAWCVLVILIGTFLMVAGTYGSVVGLINTFASDDGSAAWSCADNSNTV
ncbi:hypothetical protein MBLNU13_g00567t1 [Cladosporium sp. NU13]